MEVDYFTLEEEAPQDERGAHDRETDPHRLQQRQKQIDFGKNTLGYQNYTSEIPRADRRRRVHPNTPDITRKWSKRQFAGLVRAWRRALHKWDPEHQEERDNEETGAPAPAPAPGTKRDRDQTRTHRTQGGDSRRGGRDDGRRNDRSRHDERSGRGRQDQQQQRPPRGGGGGAGGRQEGKDRKTDEGDWVMVDDRDLSPSNKRRKGDRDTALQVKKDEGGVIADVEDPAAGFVDAGDDAWFDDI